MKLVIKTLKEKQLEYQHETSRILKITESEAHTDETKLALKILEEGIEEIQEALNLLAKNELLN